MWFVEINILIAAIIFSNGCESAHLDQSDGEIKQRVVENSSEIKACDGALIELLKAVCKKELEFIKASSATNVIPDSSDFNNYYELYPNVGSYSYPFRSKRTVQSIFKQMHLKKVTHRLVDNCCRKSCSLGEMREYCPVLMLD